MTDVYYRTGAAAKLLGLSTYELRRLAEAGLIEAEYNGKQWRIPASEVERLLKAGVPPIPASPDDQGDAQPARRPKVGACGAGAGLLGPPSEDLIAGAEEVVLLENEVKSLGLRRQKEENLDWFRQRERDEADQRAADREWAETQARAERERVEAQLQAERAQDEAIRAEQRRRDWLNQWLTFAVHAPHSRWEWRDARDNVEVEAAIHDEVQPILARTGSEEPDDIVKALVLAAVERVITHWQRGKETQQILVSAGTDWLPYGARGTTAELSIWQVKAMEAADAAMGALRADAGVAEFRAVARQAVGKIVAEFEHAQDCEKLVRDLWAQVQGATADELEAAKKEAQKALAELPITASQRDRESARDGAIASLRQAIAARVAAHQAQQAQLAAEEARRFDADLKLTRLVSLVYDYLTDLEKQGDLEFTGFYDRWATATKLQEKVRPALFQELLDDPSLTAAQINKRVEVLVDAHLDAVLEPRVVASRARKR